MSSKDYKTFRSSEHKSRSSEHHRSSGQKSSRSEGSSGLDGPARRPRSDYPKDKPRSSEQYRSKEQISSSSEYEEGSSKQATPSTSSRRSRTSGHKSASKIARNKDRNNGGSQSKKATPSATWTPSSASKSNSEAVKSNSETVQWKGPMTSTPKPGEKRAAHEMSHTGFTPDQKKPSNPGKITIDKDKSIAEKVALANFQFTTSIPLEGDVKSQDDIEEAHKSVYVSIGDENSQLSNLSGGETENWDTLEDLSVDDILIIEERIKRTSINDGITAPVIKEEPLEEGELQTAVANIVQEHPVVLSWADQVEQEAPQTGDDPLKTEAPNMEAETTQQPPVPEVLVTPPTPLSASMPPPQASEQPPSKKAKRANPAPKRPRSFAVLSIHGGKTDRAPITQEQWEQIWPALNRCIAVEAMRPTWDTNSRIDWATWAKQRGLVACTTEAMVNLVCNAVADFKIGEASFKAWKMGEKNFPNLCTVIIPPGLNFFTDEEICQILLAQNRLDGDHDKPAFSGKDAKGYRRLLIGGSDEFAAKMRSLDGVAGIAGYSVKCHIKKTAS